MQLDGKARQSKTVLVRGACETGVGRAGESEGLGLSGAEAAQLSHGHRVTVPVRVQLLARFCRRCGQTRWKNLNVGEIKHDSADQDKGPAHK
jgi:hypothetical protein